MTPVLAAVNYFEPWWVQIIKALVIFGVIFALLPILIIYERKLLGRFQGRYGPNRVGPYGLMQPLAEIVKFARKEAFEPTTAVGWMFRIAPMIAILTAVTSLAIIPFGNVQRIFGQEVGLYGIEVLVPGRDARRRTADLLRGLARTGARRRADHRADAVDDRNRPRPGRD